MRKISKFLSLSKKLGLEIETIKKLESLISNHNGNLYIIGGNVRDLILDKKISSGSDIVVDLKIKQFPRFNFFLWGRFTTNNLTMFKTHTIFKIE